jgi:hypothetical protein
MALQSRSPTSPPTWGEIGDRVAPRAPFTPIPPASPFTPTAPPPPQSPRTGGGGGRITTPSAPSPVTQATPQQLAEIDKKIAEQQQRARAPSPLMSPASTAMASPFIKSGVPPMSPAPATGVTLRRPTIAQEAESIRRAGSIFQPQVSPLATGLKARKLETEGAALTAAGGALAFRAATVQREAGLQMSRSPAEEARVQSDIDRVNKDIEDYNRRIAGFEERRMAVSRDIGRLSVSKPTGLPAWQQEQVKALEARFKEERTATQRVAERVDAYGETFGTTLTDPMGPARRAIRKKVAPEIDAVRQDRLAVQALTGVASAQRVIDISKIPKPQQLKDLPGYLVSTRDRRTAVRRAAVSEPIEMWAADRSGTERFFVRAGTRALESPERLILNVVAGTGTGVLTARGISRATQVLGTTPVRRGLVKGTSLAGGVLLTGGAGVLATKQIMAAPDRSSKAGEVAVDFAAFGIGGFAGARAVSAPRGVIRTRFRQERTIDIDGIPRQIPAQTRRTADIITEFQRGGLRGPTQVQVRVKPDESIVQTEKFASGLIRSTAQRAGARTAIETQITPKGVKTFREVAPLQLGRSPLFDVQAQQTIKSSDTIIQTPTQATLIGQQRAQDILTVQQRGLTGFVRRTALQTERVTQPAARQTIAEITAISPKGQRAIIDMRTRPEKYIPVELMRGKVAKQPPRIQTQFFEKNIDEVFRILGPQSQIIKRGALVTTTPSPQTQIKNVLEMRGTFTLGKQKFPRFIQDQLAPTRASRLFRGPMGKRGQIAISRPVFETPTIQRVDIPGRLGLPRIGTQTSPIAQTRLGATVVPRTRIGASSLRVSFALPKVTPAMGVGASAVSAGFIARSLTGPLIAAKPATSPFVSSIPFAGALSLPQVTSLTQVTPDASSITKLGTVTQPVSITQLGTLFSGARIPGMPRLPRPIIPGLLIPNLPGGGSGRGRTDRLRAKVRKGPTKTVFEQAFALDLKKLGVRQQKGISEITGVGLRR